MPSTKSMVVTVTTVSQKKLLDTADWQTTDLHVQYVLFSPAMSLIVWYGTCCSTYVSVWRAIVNYIDTKAKCRHLKKMTCKRLCGKCLSEFIDWRYSQSCWYFHCFRPSFVNCCPSNLFCSSTLTPPPSSCVKGGG